MPEDMDSFFKMDPSEKQEHRPSKQADRRFDERDSYKTLREKEIMRLRSYHQQHDEHLYHEEEEPILHSEPEPVHERRREPRNYHYDRNYDDARSYERDRYPARHRPYPEEHDAYVDAEDRFYDDRPCLTKFE